MRRSSKTLVAMLVIVVVGIPTALALAQDGGEGDDAAARAAEMQAINDARSAPRDGDSAGVPVADCPGATERLNGAGMAVSAEDHIYPDCSAVDSLIEVFAGHAAKRIGP